MNEIQILKAGYKYVTSIHHCKLKSLLLTNRFKGVTFKLLRLRDGQVAIYTK